MTSNTKWYECTDDYILPTIPWAPHIVSYTVNYETEKEDKQEDNWTTVVIKKRKQNNQF